MGDSHHHMNAAPTIASVPLWCSPPESLALDGGEVHAWRATLDQPASQIQSLLLNLSTDEQTRAGRFHFARDRARFVVGRGVLRAILGHYLNREPACLSFCYGSHGKPALAEQFDQGAIRFNMSHSHGVALYALTRGREVGIDIERIRFDLAVAEIADRFFSRRESAMLRALPVASQHQAFFRCWTRKEAYIKARGEGLSLPLDQFDTLPVVAESGAVFGTEQSPPETSRWSIQDLFPLPGYAAALAVEGHGWQLADWQWPEPSQQSV
jgi:4'-phosphopantetheinyl transferase